jgi:hypothetical protein
LGYGGYGNQGGNKMKRGADKGKHGEAVCLFEGDAPFFPRVVGLSKFLTVP